MRVDSNTSGIGDGGALILGAGFSRRFGSDKRTHLLPDGTPLLLATARCYSAVFENLCIVLRNEDVELTNQIATSHPAARVVHAADAHLGMGHSLAAGMRAVIDAQWRYVCIALADMPYVQGATLSALCEQYLSSAADSIIQPTYQGQPGHPVIFGAAWHAELSLLTGDQGARALISEHPEHLLRIPFDDPGIMADVDRIDQVRDR